MLNTKHAACRLQQRGISQMVVDLLLQFGRSEPSGSGTSKFFFDKHSRRKVKAYAGSLAGMLEDHLDVYAVVGADTQVITVGHRLERIRCR